MHHQNEQRLPAQSTTIDLSHRPENGRQMIESQSTSHLSTKPVRIAPKGEAHSDHDGGCQQDGILLDNRMSLWGVDPQLTARIEEEIDRCRRLYDGMDEEGVFGDGRGQMDEERSV